MATEPQGQKVGEWLRQHPWRGVARMLWVLFNAGWGSALAVMAAGGPAVAGWFWSLAAGLIGGALDGALWARQQVAFLSGQVEIARRWRRGLFLAHGALIVGVVLLTGVQLYRLGILPPLSQDRVAGFERCTAAMAAYYPYFERKGVDWETTIGRYGPQVEAVESNRAYYGVVETMLAELNDAHTGLRPALVANEGCFFAATREIEGQAVVVQIGGSGVEAGLTIGATIQRVDGQPLAAALEAIDPRLIAGSTARQRRGRAFQFLLHTPLGGRREIAFQIPSGEARQATLTCPVDPAAVAAARRGGEVWDLLLPLFRKQIVSRRLSSGVGYIRIPTFGADLVSDFDMALDELMDAPALILDLRGNSGGSSLHADRMAGRLLDESFTYGHDRYVRRLPLRLWRKRWPFRITPRGPVYEGPVVVLIDAHNMSSAEEFLVSLVDSGRVTTVGRATGGASGNPVVCRLPGGHNIRYSTAAFYRNDGTPIEGVGLVPDLEVTWSVADLRQGRDPDLAAAEALLLNEMGGAE